MRDYLLFTLAAPIASFGAIAVGERRPTWDRPGKSQIVGLIAGALGIERQDEASQQELASAIGFAVRIDNAGQLASDYHTTQVPPQRRNRRFATRAEELAVPKAELKTILSRREFRTDAVCTICVWLTAPGRWTLDGMANALCHPAFIPFAGRKANALMLPLLPIKIATPDDLHAAFNIYDEAIPDAVRVLHRDCGIRYNDRPVIFADIGATDDPAEIHQRRDQPQSRAKWRFDLRSEARLRPEPQKSGGTE